MKQILLATLVIGILLLSACGAPTTAPPTEAPPTPPPTEQPTPAPTPTEPEPTPAEFVLSNLQAVPTPGAGSGYSVSVEIENIGGSKGVYELTSKVDDKYIETIEVQLNPNEKKTVTLSETEFEIGFFAMMYSIDNEKRSNIGKEHIISVDSLSVTVTFPEPTLPAKPEKEWEIIDIDAKVTEKNPTWWKISWKLVLRNDGSSPLAFNATIEFLDAEGFIVDDDRAYDLQVNPGEEKTFTGYALVTASIAPNIKSVHAKVKER